MDTWAEGSSGRSNPTLWWALLHGTQVIGLRHRFPEQPIGHAIIFRGVAVRIVTRWRQGSNSGGSLAGAFA